MHNVIVQKHVFKKQNKNNLVYLYLFDLGIARFKLDIHSTDGILRPNKTK